jgi:hypothetical protein
MLSGPSVPLHRLHAHRRGGPRRRACAPPLARRPPCLTSAAPSCRASSAARGRSRSSTAACASATSSGHARDRRRAARARRRRPGAGDHLLVVLQNRWEMATLHWACQFAGIVMTPLNWRAKPEEIDYCLADAEAKRDRLGAGCGRRGGASAAARAPGAAHRRERGAMARRCSFEDWMAAAAEPTPAGRGAEDLSLMLYTTRHHRQAQGRAAPPARRARRRAGPCGAEPLCATASARWA